MYGPNNPAPTVTSSAQTFAGFQPRPAQPGGIPLVAPRTVPHTGMTVPGAPVHLPGPRLPAAQNRVVFPASPQV